MSVDSGPLLTFDNSFARDLAGLFEPWQAAHAPAPQLVALNDELALELGLDAEWLSSPEGVAVLVGNAVPDGALPIAQAYAGHQFGGYSPRLGDGRALLIGEIHDRDGRRRDLHLKGSGRTPFAARGGDGKAAIGPMLREYVIGEAMHVLGIPTTRALAVVVTGELIPRDAMLPGAVLARVAASHLRVGSFQYASAQHDPTLLRRLADHAIDRHHPHARDAANPYLALFESVLDVQASLVAQWMLVGFIHGVMNTDNMTISGETIDYGPCAFMDTFDPATVFSSIDHGGRYAYGNQPQIAQWNLVRLAESMLPLFGDDVEAAAASATEVLQSFPDRYGRHWTKGMSAKLGLRHDLADPGLIAETLAMLKTHTIDFTSFFRSLSAVLRDDATVARSLFADPAVFDVWSARWLAEVDRDGGDRLQIAAATDRVNPIYIPRNSLVEEALAAATEGDLQPFGRLVDAVSDPYVERDGLDRYAHAGPKGPGLYQTFCGT